MGKVIFITQKDLKDFTNMSGNVDPDKLMSSINAAQDLELEPILGTALVTKLSTEIENETLSGFYEELVVEYIKPVLCWYSLSMAIPYLAYSISNGGLFKHQSESSITPDKSEIDYLTQNARTKGQDYANRMIKWLCAFNSEIPEYNQLEKGGEWASKKNQSFGGINF